MTGIGWYFRLLWDRWWEGSGQGCEVLWIVSSLVDPCASFEFDLKNMVMLRDPIGLSCEQLSRSAYSELASLAETHGMKVMSRCEKLSLGELVVVIANHV